MGSSTRHADETVPAPESHQGVLALVGREGAYRRRAGNRQSKPHHMICPFCESGELVSLGHDFARCGSCGLPLLGSTLETLRGITGLPDALACQVARREAWKAIRILPQVVQAELQERRADPTLHPDIGVLEERIR